MKSEQTAIHNRNLQKLTKAYPVDQTSSQVASSLMRFQKGPSSKSFVFIMAVASILENGLKDLRPTHLKICVFILKFGGQNPPFPPWVPY